MTLRLLLMKQKHHSKKNQFCGIILPENNVALSGLSSPLITYSKTMSSASTGSAQSFRDWHCRATPIYLCTSLFIILSLFHQQTFSQKTSSLTCRKLQQVPNVYKTQSLISPEGLSAFRNKPLSASRLRSRISFSFCRWRHRGSSSRWCLQRG